MVRYTSSDAYKKLAYYGADQGGFTYNCGQGTPQKIESLELKSDIIDGKVFVVISPYSTVYPVQIDKIFLKLIYRQQNPEVSI